MHTYLNADVVAGLERPADAEAERRLLSALLQCPTELLGLAMSRVNPDLFTIPNLAKIATTIIDEWKERKLKPDFGLISQRLDTETLRSVLSDLRSSTDPTQVLNYLERCEERQRARITQAAAFQLLRKLSDGEALNTALTDFQSGVAVTGNGGANFLAAGDVIEQRYAALMNSINDPAAIRPISTGVQALDLATGGLLNELVVIAAANSVGKSAMLNTIVEANINQLREDEFLYFVSAEMTNEEVIDRTISTRLRMNSALFRAPQHISKSDWTRIFAQKDVLNDRLCVTYDPEVLPEHIWSNLLTQQTRGRKCRAVFVDFLQLLGETRLSRGTSKAGELRFAVAAVLRELKELGKRNRIPVIVAAQVNRDPERQRPDRPVPTMFNIAECANVEQIADIGLLLYRHHRFFPQAACATEAEIHIGKMRNGGSVGIIPASYLGPYTLFTDRLLRCECQFCLKNKK